MGLDIYAGPVCRYVAGDWVTIVQAAAEAAGIPVEVVRLNESEDTVTDVAVVTDVVTRWRDGLFGAVGGEPWQEDPMGPYRTDKPDWDGYGAVLLLAAYEEQPELAPGAAVRRGLRRSSIAPVLPLQVEDSPAFIAASASPKRYATLLLQAEWCLPATGGPPLSRAPTPNGKEITMGKVDTLLSELELLNARTLRLGPDELREARRQGPPERDAPLEQVAPFGLSIMLELAQYAVTNRVAWILDY